MKLSALSEMGACQKRRKYYSLVKEEILPAEVKSTLYKRAEIGIDTIQQCLRYEEKDKNNIMIYMNSRYVECGFVNPQQKRQVLLEDWRRVYRYLRSEQRKVIFPVKREISISKNLEPILVKPHAAFPCGKSIELVIYKIGKPNITKNGAKDRISRELQLYALICYGRELGYENITASFYFLKKENDVSNWEACEEYFFSGGSNIISMNDIYLGEKNNLDKQMEERVDLFERGLTEEEQCEDTCKYCEFHNVCKYKKAPVSIAEE